MQYALNPLIILFHLILFGIDKKTLDKPGKQPDKKQGQWYADKTVYHIRDKQ